MTLEYEVDVIGKLDSFPVRHRQQPVATMKTDQVADVSKTHSMPCGLCCSIPGVGSRTCCRQVRCLRTRSIQGQHLRHTLTRSAAPLALEPPANMPIRATWIRCYHASCVWSGATSEVQKGRVQTLTFRAAAVSTPSVHSRVSGSKQPSKC